MTTKLTHTVSQAEEAATAESVPGRKSRWMAWSERVLLGVLVLYFITKAFLPAWTHLNSDFPNYYLVASLYRRGYPVERVYDWTWFQREWDHTGSEHRVVSYHPLTEPSALVIAPWARLRPLPAKHVWLVMNLLFLALTAVLLKFSTTIRLRTIALLIFLATFPLRDNFLLGQWHVFVLLLLTLAAWLYFGGRFFSSGMVLAIAAGMKIYPALFLIYFVFRKQWRAALGLIVGLLAVAALSVGVFGWDACVIFAREVLPRALRAETIDPYNVEWGSLSALLRRLLVSEPELNPSPVAHVPWLFALLQPLLHGLILVVFMWAIGLRTGKSEGGKLEWAGYLFMLLLVSPQPAPYHFVALILVAVLVIDDLVRHQQPALAGWVALIYALICGPLHRVPRPAVARGWSNLLFFPKLAVLVVFAGVLLGILISRAPESFRSGLYLRNAAIAGCCLIALVTVGFVSNLRHLKGQFENYKSRLFARPDDPLFASDPKVTASGIWFVGMTKDGYVLRRLRAGLVQDFAGTEGDWIHPAALEQGSTVWVEQAWAGGSRVMHFLADDAAQSAAAMTVEAEEAEEPVVSADGELLAFTREVKGRNSLWIRPLQGDEKTKAASERQIVGAEYDVRDASFAPDHRLVFSARRQGRFRLHVVEQSGKIEEMSNPICSARYPAISPDGEWMAFSCEQGGSWQLHSMNRRTGEDVQLTSAECNSITPAWTLDSKRLVYATDCGRGLGLTALAEVRVR
jgi:glycosyl transferase family 87/WD40 repeat protein